jgi:hypothetical protein
MNWIILSHLPNFEGMCGADTENYTHMFRGDHNNVKSLILFLLIEPVLRS